MVFSEFTNKIKYSNRISSHLQKEGISGFTECLIMRQHAYKKQVFKLLDNLRINVKQHILFLIF